jgi:putative addiction module killer protein
VDIKVIEYVTHKGACPYRDWLKKLDGPVRFRVQARIMKLVDFSHFGSARSLGDGLFELKFKKLGGGIRVYYGVADGILVVLLSGGNKGRQQADISKAREYWNDYLITEEGE